MNEPELRLFIWYAGMFSFGMVGLAIHLITLNKHLKQQKEDHERLSRQRRSFQERLQDRREASGLQGERGIQRSDIRLGSMGETGKEWKLFVHQVLQAVREEQARATGQKGRSGHDEAGGQPLRKPRRG